MTLAVFRKILDFGRNTADQYQLLIDIRRGKITPESEHASVLNHINLLIDVIGDEIGQDKLAAMIVQRQAEGGARPNVDNFQSGVLMK